MREDLIHEAAPKGSGWRSLLTINPTLDRAETESGLPSSALGQASRVQPAASADREAAFRRELQAGYLQTHCVQSGLPNHVFLQLAETANDVIIVTSADVSRPGPLIVYVNQAFSRLTGHSAAEAIGRSPRFLQGDGTSRATLDRIAAGLRAGEPVHEKVLNYAKNGAPYWLDLRIVPLRDATGAITHFAAIERDVTTEKRRLDELEFVADRDTLTGIHNRRALLRVAEEEIRAADTRRRAGVAGQEGPCLAFIDVDHFKRVNDLMGHAVGDAVLFGMAETLTANARRADLVGRIGGEEFAVVMPDITLGEAETLAERLRHAVAAKPFETASGRVSVTVSIGVACCREGESLTQLMERADGAMYAAKRGGRDRVEIAESGLATCRRDRMEDRDVIFRA